MSAIDFEGIKVTSEHKENGAWWGDAKEIDGVTIDERADTATGVGVLFAGKAAVDIVRRGYSFADPTRDEPDLDPSSFADERLVEGVLLRPHGIHAFQRHVSLGVGLFSPDSEANKPFGLVVPGKGTILHRDGVGDFDKMVAEAREQGLLDKPIDFQIASKAIGICAEYAKLPQNSGVLALR